MADALFRLNENTSQLYQTSMVIPFSQQEAIKSYEEDDHAQEMITQLSVDSQAITDYQLTNRLLKFQGRIYIGDKEFEGILQELHNEECGGHCGIQVTNKRI